MEVSSDILHALWIQKRETKERKQKSGLMWRIRPCVDITKNRVTFLRLLKKDVHLFSSFNFTMHFNKIVVRQQLKIR